MATRSKRFRLLNEVYAQVPGIVCKGLCTDQCSVIPLFETEVEYLEAGYGKPLPLDDDLHHPGMAALKVTSDGSCPVLKDGRCSGYMNRPLICRLFGVAQGLPCRHGCVAERVITDREAQTLMRTLHKL